MFSVQQKRDISDAVQKILRATNHPELPTTGEIGFTLHVDGAGDWSWADIQNNAAVGDPGMNPHNEAMASMPEEKARSLIEEAQDLAARPDPRATPEEFMKEMLDKQILSANQRLQKVESIVLDQDTRLARIEEFLTPIIEDNLIAHHSTQLNDVITMKEDNKSLHTRIDSLETAIKQLGTGQLLRKESKKCPDCGIEEGMEHAPDCAVGAA